MAHATAAPIGQLPSGSRYGTAGLRFTPYFRFSPGQHAGGGLSEITSLTLLENLKKGPTGESWSLFMALYQPLLVKWKLGAGLQQADAEDIAQETLWVVNQKISAFSRSRRGSFRRWPRRTARNLIRRMQHKAEPAMSLQEIDKIDLAVPGEEESQQRIFRRPLPLQRKMNQEPDSGSPPSWSRTTWASESKLFRMSIGSRRRQIRAGAWFSMTRRTQGPGTAWQGSRDRLNPPPQNDRMDNGPEARRCWQSVEHSHGNQSLDAWNRPRPILQLPAPQKKLGFAHLLRRQSWVTLWPLEA